MNIIFYLIRIKTESKRLDYSKKHESRLGYDGDFFTIPLITDYIKIEELETIR